MTGSVTGFMSDHRQIGEVNHFLDLFHKEGTFLLVDPVLGDNGKRFSVFDGLFQKEMKQLVKRADIVTPNVTELCLLTDYDYDKIQNISETGDREALFFGSVESGRQTFGQWRIGSDRDRGVI